MKKLSKEEINVIIREVNDRVEKKSKLECENVLSKNKKYEEIVEFVKELNELEDLVKDKVKFINEKVEVLEKEVNFKVSLYKESSLNNYKLNYWKNNNNSYKCYNEMYNKLVLRNINSNLNVEELINELIKDFNN
jgi:hypothetical protein